MTFYKYFIPLLSTILLIVVTVTVGAETPSTFVPNSVEPTETPPPVKGNFEPVSIQPRMSVLDPATARVTHLEPAEDDPTSIPAMPTPPESPPIKGATGPSSMKPTRFDGETLRFMPLSPDELRLNQAPEQEIEGAASTEIVFEDFEGAFPTSGWSRVDEGGTGHLWDDVGCFAMNGNRSIWPADGGANGLDPCSGGVDYPPNLNSWLIFGPFSLADAQSAQLDFYFRIESESNIDIFSWGASIDGATFFGQGVSGILTDGPFPNGYNFVSFDLTNVFTLGDLTGQPNVWIGFQFFTDSTVNGQGPFIDGISLRKNSDVRRYLTQEDIETETFPNPGWQSVDAGGSGHFWDDVSNILGSNCPPHSGYWSMWPGAVDWPFTGPDPCGAGHSYANNMRTWLIHGPFDLTEGSEAWVDFYFRNESELVFDTFFWGVSTDGFNFSGFGITGTQTNGPYKNGYNLVRLDLTETPFVGDLRGESQVWLGFSFTSDETITFQGPFVDDISVIIEAQRQLFLPTILKNPAPTPPSIPKTNLFIQNNTTGAATYTIKNPTLDGNPIPDMTCNIPHEAKVFCGTFDAGTYQVTSSSPCGTGQGSRTFPAGDYELVPPLHCL